MQLLRLKCPQARRSQQTNLRIWRVLSWLREPTAVYLFAGCRVEEEWRRNQCFGTSCFGSLFGNVYCNLVNLEITQTCGSDSPWAWGAKALLVRDVRKPQSINKIAKFGLEMLEGRASFSVWRTQRWQRLQSIKKIAWAGKMSETTCVPGDQSSVSKLLPGYVPQWSGFLSRVHGLRLFFICTSVLGFSSRGHVKN